MRSDDVLRALLGDLAPDGNHPVSDGLRSWAASGGMWLTGRTDDAPSSEGNGAASVAAALVSAIRNARHSACAEIPGPTVLGERAALTGRSRAGAHSVGGATRLLATADGHVAVSLARPDDVEALPALVESPVSGDPWNAVAQWAAARRGAEVVGRGRLLGMAVSALGEKAGWPDGSAVLTSSRGAPTRGGRPFVVDLSSLWAGPLCAHILALTGADVVKVESPSRPDGARRGPVAFFDLLHSGSRSLSLDFRRDIHLLRALLQRADVIITSSRTRAWTALGIEPSEFTRRGAVWTAITAYGSDQEADRIGFGDDVAAAAGLVGTDDNGPFFIGDAVADPLTGLAAAAATLQALDAARGCLLDVAMVRVAQVAALASSTAPSLVRRDRYGWWLPWDGRRLRVEPPTPRFATGVAPRMGADNGLLGSIGVA